MDVTEEDAFNFTVRYLREGRKGPYSEYGYELFVPNIARAYGREVLRLRAPGHVEHRFRRKPNTHSGASRTPIPTQAEHRFRAARTP